MTGENINNVVLRALTGMADLEGWAVRLVSTSGVKDGREGQSVHIEIIDEKRVEYFDSLIIESRSESSNGCAMIECGVPEDEDAQADGYAKSILLDALSV